jgi:hypothetical protein
VNDRIATVGDVIARLEAIGDEIASDHGRADGVGWFNLLYLTVTKEVGVALARNEFSESAFVERLDVDFAGLYFRALDADRQGKKLPKAWKPLFEQRADTGIAPIQFAIAGMNAHINHDLSHALVSTWDALGKTDRNTAAHADYEQVNNILEGVEANVKKVLEDEFIAGVDTNLGRVDDVVAMWSVAHAREQAWTTAEAFWDLRDFPGADGAIEAAVDGLVGFAGHGLLQRIGLG